MIEVHFYDGNRGPLFHLADKVDVSREEVERQKPANGAWSSDKWRNRHDTRHRTLHSVPFRYAPEPEHRFVMEQPFPPFAPPRLSSHRIGPKCQQVVRLGPPSGRRQVDALSGDCPISGAPTVAVRTLESIAPRFPASR